MKRRCAPFVVLSIALAALASGVRAQTALVGLGTGNAVRGWLGVGKLMVGSHEFCTGALVGPALVLTAAHCLYDEATGRRVPVSAMRFLDGWRDGRAEAYRGVKAAVAYPGYRYGRHTAAGAVPKDLALLALDHPILLNQVPPFPVTPIPGPGGRVAVVSYSEAHAAVPVLQRACDVLARQQGMLVLDCKVDFGASGAPVFVMTLDGAAIASVISARADVSGRQVALAPAVEHPLAALKAALAADSPGGAQVDVAGGGQVRILRGGGAFRSAPDGVSRIAPEHAAPAGAEPP